MATRAIKECLVRYKGQNQLIYRVWIPSKRTVIQYCDMIINNDKDLAIIDFQQNILTNNQLNKENSKLNI